MKDPGELERELRRAHGIIADLRLRLDVCERALREAYLATVGVVGAKSRPPRRQVGTDAAGEPIYEPEEPDTSTPQPDDNVIGAWPRSRLKEMDGAFKRALKHERAEVAKAKQGGNG